MPFSASETIAFCLLVLACATILVFAYLTTREMKRGLKQRLQAYNEDLERSKKIRSHIQPPP